MSSYFILGLIFYLTYFFYVDMVLSVWNKVEPSYVFKDNYSIFPPKP